MTNTGPTGPKGLPPLTGPAPALGQIPGAPSAASVDEALAHAASTGQSNELVAVIKRFDKRTQKEEKSRFVRKAGRSGKLNEAAQKKGGIAYMGHFCVRASWESPEQIRALYDKLPPNLQEKFLESRGYDFRVFTAPGGKAIYRQKILFGSGEKWEGEGIADRDNCDNPEWMDAIGATRAFNRTVGFGTAEGLISVDDLAGSEGVDPDDLPELDGEDEEGDEGRAVSVAAANEAEGAPPLPVPVNRILPDDEEASPAGDERFRTSVGAGQGGTAADAGSQGGGPEPGSQAGGHEAAGSGEPGASNGAVSGEQAGGGAGPDAQAEELTAGKLIGLAITRKVIALDLAKAKFGVKTLNQLSPVQLKDLWDEIGAMPIPAPTRKG